MKKWLLVLFSMLLLAACSDSSEQPTAKLIEHPDKDVQGVVDMTDKELYASLLYNAGSDSYLILNSTGTPTVTLKEDGEDLHISIADEETAGDTKSSVFGISMENDYDTIHLFKNDEEIAFDIWYGQQ